MLKNEFITLCNDYAKSRDDVIHIEQGETKKYYSYAIEFFRYKVEFRYTKKESVFIKNGSLYCVIYPFKYSCAYYHLTDIIPLLENKNFKACYFPLVESRERMQTCFSNLACILKGVTSGIEPLIEEGTLLRNSLYESYKTVYNLKEDEIDFSKIDDKQEYNHDYFLRLQEMRDGYLFSTFSTAAAYSNLLKGKVDKAIERYKKAERKGKLLEYEKQLLLFLENPQNRGFEFMSNACDSTKKANSFNSFLSSILAFLVVFILSSIVFCGLIALYNFLVSRDTLVLLSAPWYIGCLCAGLCSVFGAIAFFPFMPNKKLTKEERINFSKLLISKGVRKFALIVFVISVIISLIFAVLIMRANVRFYDNKIAFSYGEFGEKTKNHTYEEIDSVYFIKARYNVYDERIERSSYVILFKDKTSVDLDGFATVEQTENQVLPLLKEKGFDVMQADSEKQLPWYTE